MASQDDIDELKAKAICFKCVGEPYLRAEIQKDGARRRCSYCQKTRRSYEIGEMAERIADVFGEHYVRTSDEPDSMQRMMLSDRESSYDWERDGEPVVWAIMNSADIPEEAAEAIQAVLEDANEDFDSAAMGEETEFSADTHYEEKGADDRAWQDEWNFFEQSLKTEARFFSRTAARHLASVFGGLSDMKASDGRPLVVAAGPGTQLGSLYRARVFQSNERLEEALCRPDQHLGPPPPRLANAGRMNARGISVFYGANTASVALAEVRPPVGSQVAVARFEIIRPLRLLDLTALADVHERGSIFDPSFGRRLERAMFLRSLSQRITRPVMPDDEAFEYLPTQAVADFLATEAELPLDGVLFPSAQATGAALNAVLFHKAARVEAMELPEGTKVTASTGEFYEEGWEREYTVTEETPPASVEPPRRRERPWLDLSSMVGTWTPPDPDSREASLRIVVDSVVVHVVDRVEVDTSEHQVHRRRWEKRPLKF